MAFTLQDFRSKVRDLARNYLFELEMVMPVVVGTTDLVNVLVKTTNTPKKSNAPVEAKFMGQPYFLAGQPTYDPWTCTFRIDDNHDAYKRFRAWSELILGTESNIASFPSQYKSTVNLYQLDVAGNRLVAFTLQGAFLSTLGDIAVDYSLHTPQECQLTFEYDFFTFKVL